MKQGDAVIIKVKAGAVLKGEAGTASKFVGDVFPGQHGLYVGPVQGTLGHEDWHVVALGAWDVPLHRSMFDEAETGA